jgi:hypothetical protein
MMRDAGLTRRRMKIMLSISQSIVIVDASRLDLSSPAQAIHPLGLMNQTPTIVPSPANDEHCMVNLKFIKLRRWI